MSERARRKVAHTRTPERIALDDNLALMRTATKKAHDAALHVLTHGDQHERCLAATKLLASRHDAKLWFAKPVNTDAVPDYLDVIKDPIDLRTIAYKLERREYPSLAAFQLDVRRVFTNAVTYNFAATHPCHVAAKACLVYFDALYEHVLDPENAPPLPQSEEPKESGGGGSKKKKRKGGGRAESSAPKKAKVLGGEGKKAGAADAEGDTAATATREQQARILEALAAYVAACGGRASLVEGWRVTVKVRRSGNTAGVVDTSFFPPNGRRTRSRAAIDAYFHLGDNGRRTAEQKEAEENFRNADLEVRREVRRAAAEAGIGNKLFVAPTAAMDLVPDAELPQLAPPENPLPPRPFAVPPVAGQLSGDAVASLLHVCDFVRTFGEEALLPSFEPAELAAAVQPQTHVEAAGLPAAVKLAQLHQGLLVLVLADPELSRWWGTAQDISTADGVRSVDGRVPWWAKEGEKPALRCDLDAILSSSEEAARTRAWVSVLASVLPVSTRAGAPIREAILLARHITTDAEVRRYLTRVKEKWKLYAAGLSKYSVLWLVTQMHRQKSHIFSAADAKADAEMVAQARVELFGEGAAAAEDEAAAEADGEGEAAAEADGESEVADEVDEEADEDVGEEASAEAAAGFSALVSSSAAAGPENLIGNRISVYWDGDEQWYSGQIWSYDPEEKLHLIIYDDESDEKLDLSEVRHKVAFRVQELRRSSAQMPPKESDVTLFSWPPLVAGMVARLLHHWDPSCALDDEQLSEDAANASLTVAPPPYAEGERDAATIVPLAAGSPPPPEPEQELTELGRAVRALLTPMPSAAHDAYARLPAAQKLLLLRVLVDGACDSHYVANSAEFRASTASRLQAQMDDMEKDKKRAARAAKEEAREAVRARLEEEGEGPLRATDIGDDLVKAELATRAQREACAMPTGRKLALYHRRDIARAERKRLIGLELSVETGLNSKGNKLSETSMGRLHDDVATIKARHEKAAMKQRDKVSTQLVAACAQAEESGGIDAVRAIDEALAAAREVGLEGRGALDCTPYASRSDRWMTHEVCGAYLALLELKKANEEQLQRGKLLLEQESTICRTIALGRDRFGRRYWPLLPYSEWCTEAERTSEPPPVPSIWVQPRSSDVQGGLLPDEVAPDDEGYLPRADGDAALAALEEADAAGEDPRLAAGWLERREAAEPASAGEWQLLVGKDACIALARSLDTRGSWQYQLCNAIGAYVRNCEIREQASVAQAVLDAIALLQPSADERAPVDTSRHEPLPVTVDTTPLPPRAASKAALGRIREVAEDELEGGSPEPAGKRSRQAAGNGSRRTRSLEEQWEEEDDDDDESA